MAKRTYKVLVLIVHSAHNRLLSIYGLLSTMVQNPACTSIHVASRGNPKNKQFFYDYQTTNVHVMKVMPSFTYEKNGLQFVENTVEKKLNDYDVVMVRMPPPLDKSFLSFLLRHFPRSRIINDPVNMLIAGSKQYLLNYQHMCPPMKLCTTKKDILEFSNIFPIVLKPLCNFGGKGIVKIMGSNVWLENGSATALNEFLDKLPSQFAYLGMKYLNDVVKGDKRILIVNGRILGACLRMPPKDSWLCNVSQGGTPAFSEADHDEIAMAKELSIDMKKRGIVIFGFDTLEDDNGKRVLSEINVINVGGLINAQLMSGMPIVKTASDLMWKYIERNIQPIRQVLELDY